MYLYIPSSRLFFFFFFSPWCIPARKISERDVCEQTMHGSLFRVRLFPSNGDRRARLTAHTTVWFCSCLLSDKRGKATIVWKPSQLAKHVSLQASRRRLCRPCRRSRITVDPISPREWGRHPSTVGDLESQVLDYDNLIHLSALVVSFAWV